MSTSDYEKLKNKYNELLEEKREVIDLIKEIQRLKTINKKIRKDNIELSYLLTELMKERNNKKVKK